MRRYVGEFEGLDTSGSNEPAAEISPTGDEATGTGTDTAGATACTPFSGRATSAL